MTDHAGVLPPGEKTDADAGDERPGMLYVSVAVDDPECLEALHEYPEGRARQDFVRAALKIGILALKHARGRIDGEAVRREGEHLLGLLAERLEAYRAQTTGDIAGALKVYFDPADGRFNERVERLVKQDGELARAMQAQVAQAEATLRGVLVQHLGEDSPLLKMLAPDESNRLLAAIRGSVDEVLAVQKTAILREFSMDNAEGALARLLRELASKHGDLTADLGRRIGEVVAEFSLDREDSALSRLVRRVDEAQRRINSEFSLDAQDSALSRMRRELLEVLEAQRRASGEFQQTVITALETLRARKDEAARSTVHGLAFQSAVARVLADFGHKAGDVVTDVGNETGAVPRSKVGDLVVELGRDCVAAGARIVVEAKEDASYTLRTTLAEIEEARRNREAGVGLFVHSARTAPADLPALARHGDDVVLVWDADDEATDVVLRAGLLLAKALCVRAAAGAAQQAASVAEMEAAVREIERQVEGLEEIRTRATTVVNAGQAIHKRAELMQERIARRLQELADHVGRMRTPGGTD